MERNKDSIATRATQRCNKAKGKVDEAESHELYHYFANLPDHLTTKILLQLPIKPLLICRCVCKIWKTMISEPHFAKLHFDKTPVSLMIRTNHRMQVSRTLYHLECDPEKFEIGSNKHVKLDPIFKLPLRNGKNNNENNNKGRQSLYLACNPNLDKFSIVNSCNGLLCLSDPSIGNPLVVCNPITGEFIKLPEASTPPFRLNSAGVRMQGQAGLGFQPKTNEYKVIKMWTRHVERGNDWVFERVILDINTLGTPLWRNFVVDPQVYVSSLNYPTCVNGALHWLGFEDRQRSILCFCLERERLHSFPSPPHVFGTHMGELMGFLYNCDLNFSSKVTMWVMNEYGNGDSWTKLYSINTLVNSLGYPGRSYYGLCLPVKHFEEGAAIFLYDSCNCFIYYDPEKYGFKVFQIHGSRSDYLDYFEVLTHIPSLISLKDVVKGDNIEILNIYSRCAKFKFWEEDEVLSLSQQIV